MKETTGFLLASINSTSDPFRRDALVAEMRGVIERLEADARARWSVRVLDAWVKAGRARAITAWDNFTAGVELFDATELRNDGRKFEASTPDAARHAAAKVVLPTLPADVRADLGECP